MNLQKDWKKAAAYAAATLIAGAAALTAAGGQLHADEYLGCTPEAEGLKAEKLDPEVSESMWKAQLSKYGDVSLKSYRSKNGASRRVKTKGTGIAGGRRVIGGIGLYRPGVYGVEGVDGYVPGQTDGGYDISGGASVSGSFELTSYGEGSGLGLSLAGADHYAKYGGLDYADILGQFYPGTFIGTDDVEGMTFSAGTVRGDALTVVSQAVCGEMTSGMDTEAIKALAVVIYTYIRYNGGTAPMLETADPSDYVTSAVSDVLGQALYFGDAYAYTPFCVSCGGETASYSDLFISSIPYLTSVHSDEDIDRKSFSFTADEVRRTLEENLGIRLSDSPEGWLSPVTGDGGYVVSVEIDGQQSISGTDFKEMFGLSSNKFEIQFCK